MRKLVILVLVILSMQGFSQNITTEYSAQVISSNFTIPVIRFDLAQAASDRKGSVSFFNNVGAGVGYYWGRITDIKDGEGKVISSEMDNTLGVQLGVLFSKGDSINVFALTTGISVLNFQLGVGYELGTVGIGNKRTFFTLNYGIPIARLIKGGFYKISTKPLSPEAAKRGFLKF